MKNTLFLISLLFYAGCYNHTSISTCDISTEKSAENHILVKLVKVDDYLNTKSTFKNKCAVYQAIEIGKKDTLNLLDIRPKLTEQVLQEYKDKATFAFFPISKDSCMICSFSSTKVLDSLKSKTYLIGYLKLITY